MRIWDGDPLLQISEGEIVLVEAEEVTEFVEVGGADFVGKDLGIPFRELPEVIQVENNPGRGGGGDGVCLQSASAFEQAEEVRLETLIQDSLVRHGLVKGHHVLGGSAKFGRQAGADALDALGSKLMQIGIQGFRLG